MLITFLQVTAIALAASLRMVPCDHVWWYKFSETISLLVQIFAYFATYYISFYNILGAMAKTLPMLCTHYGDVIMDVITSQITSLTIVYSTFYSGADQSKHQSSASLAFVRGIHRDRWIPRTKGQ